MCSKGLGRRVTSIETAGMHCGSSSSKDCLRLFNRLSCFVVTLRKYERSSIAVVSSTEAQSVLASIREAGAGYLSDTYGLSKLLNGC
jgi:hypothetical protein